MADEQQTGQSLTAPGSQSVAPTGGTSIKLGEVTSIDTTDLTPEQVQALPDRSNRGGKL